MNTPEETAEQRHWRANRRWTVIFTALGIGVTLAIIIFARKLDVRIFGVSPAYWLGAQGVIILYVALIAVYARIMRREDRRLNELAAEGKKASPPQMPDI